MARLKQLMLDEDGIFMISKSREYVYAEAIGEPRVFYDNYVIHNGKKISLNSIYFDIKKSAPNSANAYLYGSTHPIRLLGFSILAFPIQFYKINKNGKK